MQMEQENTEIWMMNCN